MEQVLHKNPHGAHMTHSDKVQAAVEATAGVEKALAILQKRATPQTMREAREVH